MSGVRNVSASRHRLLVASPALLLAPLLVGVGYLAFQLLGGGSARSVAQQLPPGLQQNSGLAAAPPDFSNTVLHWQSHVYTSVAGSTDAKNNVWSISDIWVMVGPGNRPAAARGVTTVNGRFSQAVVYDLARWTVTFVGFHQGPSAAAGPTAAGCIAPQPIPDQARGKVLAGLLPPYVDVGKLAAAGYHATSQALPALPALDHSLSSATIGAGPVRVLSIGNTARWAAPDVAGPPNGGTFKGILEADQSSGRQVGWEAFQRFPNGNETLQYAELETPIEVVATQEVPASLFSVQSLQGECRA